jgi:hypothetical protein
MDPATSRSISRIIRSAMAICAFALTSSAFAGVVPIGTSARAPETVRSPADVAVAEASVSQFTPPADGPVEHVALADSSDWLALLDEASAARNPADADAPEVAQIMDLEATAAPAAVIPLPPAVYPALITLCGAGWLAFRSRNGRRL